jgi:hypothetical protein
MEHEGAMSELTFLEAIELVPVIELEAAMFCTREHPLPTERLRDVPEEWNGDRHPIQVLPPTWILLANRRARSWPRKMPLRAVLAFTLGQAVLRPVAELRPAANPVSQKRTATESFVPPHL